MIRIKTQKCLSLFESCSNVLATTAVVDDNARPANQTAGGTSALKLPPAGTTNSNHVAESVRIQADRFRLWSANIGVMAKQRVSLDYRLRGAPDIAEKILQMLDVVNIRLSHISMDQGLDSAEQGTHEEAGLATKQNQALHSLAQDITRMQRLSYAIRRSGGTSLLSRAERYVLKDEDVMHDNPAPDLDHSRLLRIEQWLEGLTRLEIEPEPTMPRAKNETFVVDFHGFARTVLQHRYSNTDAEILEHLALFIKTRRQRFAYVRSHQLKLQHQEHADHRDQPTNLRPASSTFSQPTSDALDQMTGTLVKCDIAISTFSSTLAAAIDPKVYSEIQSQAPSSAATSVITTSSPSLANPDIPPAPFVPDNFQEHRCPYCQWTLPAKVFMHRRLWRRHVEEDLEPYLCLDPACFNTQTTFGKVQQWVAHAYEMHSRTWVCPLQSLQTQLPDDSGKLKECSLSFSSCAGLEEHLATSHTGLSVSKIRTIAHMSSKSDVQTIFASCPFCEWPLSEVQQNHVTTEDDIKAVQSHVADHLLSLATMALPERADLMFEGEVDPKGDSIQAFDSYQSEAAHSSSITLPGTLKGAYDRVLQKVPQTRVHNVIKLLQLLTFGMRSLSLDEVVDAVATKVDSTPSFHVENRAHPPESIGESCPSFITVVGEDEKQLQVQLADHSVENYLKLAHKPLPWSDHLTASVAHTSIAQICLAYLRTAAETQKDEQYINQFPLARYAAEFWMVHAKEAGEVPKHTLEWASQILTDDIFMKYWLNLHNPDELWNYHRAPALYYMPRSGLHQCSAGLLARGADINAVGGKYGNALQAACSSCSIETVRMLLQQGADVNAQGGQYGNAIQAAVSMNNVELVRILIDYGADINAQSHGTAGSALHAAASKGNGVMVQTLLEAGADIDAMNKSSQTALYLAALCGYPETVQVLLDHGADLNFKDEASRTALHKAATGGHLRVVELLLDRGADVNTQDRHSSTALDKAAMCGHLRVVELLLDRGADVNAQDRHSSTALHKAAANDRPGIIQLLLDRGANVNAQAWKETLRTPLHEACESGHPKAVQILLEHGADVRSNNETTSTLLNVASASGYEEIIRMLLDAGANPNAKDETNVTALQIASGIGYEGIVQLLLDHGAKKDIGYQESTSDHPPATTESLGAASMVADVVTEGEPSQSTVFRCPQCSRAFTRPDILKAHLRIHPAEKPYVCQTCQTRFSTLHELKSHVKLHTGERPLICDKCGRRFARGDALARHQKGPGGCAGRRRSSTEAENSIGEQEPDDSDFTEHGDLSPDVDYEDDDPLMEGEPSRKRAHIENWRDSVPRIQPYSPPATSDTHKGKNVS